MFESFCSQIGEGLAHPPTAPHAILSPSMLALVHHLRSLHNISSFFGHVSAISMTGYHLHPFSPIAITFNHFHHVSIIFKICMILLHIFSCLVILEPYPSTFIFSIISSCPIIFHNSTALLTSFIILHEFSTSFALTSLCIHFPPVSLFIIIFHHPTPVLLQNRALVQHPSIPRPQPKNIHTKKQDTKSTNSEGHQEDFCDPLQILEAWIALSKAPHPRIHFWLLFVWVDCFLWFSTVSLPSGFCLGLVWTCVNASRWNARTDTSASQSCPCSIVTSGRQCLQTSYFSAPSKSCRSAREGLNSRTDLSHTPHKTWACIGPLQACDTVLLCRASYTILVSARQVQTSERARGKASSLHHLRSLRVRINTLVRPGMPLPLQSAINKERGSV